MDNILLKSILDYDPTTGLFTWLVTRSKRVAKGDLAGYVQKKTSKSKYILIRYKGKNYPAHRLAFLFMLGHYPEGIVDHIDGNGVNNAWINLRDVSAGDNSRNMGMSKRNTSGFVGVSYDKKLKKWNAALCKEGLTTWLGSFLLKEDAIAARARGNLEFGFHTNHGKYR